MFRSKHKRRGACDITVQELCEMANRLDNIILLDVRSPQEYKEGHLEKSINLPLYEIEKDAENVISDRNSVVIVCCKSGRRSKKACEVLKQKGYNNLYNLFQGLDGI